MSQDDPRASTSASLPSPDDPAPSAPGTVRLLDSTTRTLRPPKPDASPAAPADLMTPWSDWDAKVAFANRLIASGFLPTNIRTAAQVIAIIQTGRELGLPPMQALRQINVISGKPTMSAELMLAKMLRGGITLEWIKTGEDGREAVLKGSRAHTSFTGRFTIAEAELAGLLTKDGWKKYRPAMLRARVISLVARVVAPDLISGMYIPEEMGAEVNAEGEIINVTTGVAAIPDAAPVVEIRGEPMPDTPRTAQEWIDAFQTAPDAGAVATLRAEAKLAPMSLDGSLRVSQAWLDAKARTAVSPVDIDPV